MTILICLTRRGIIPEATRAKLQFGVCRGMAKITLTARCATRVPTIPCFAVRFAHHQSGARQNLAELTGQGAAATAGQPSVDSASFVIGHLGDVRDRVVVSCLSQTTC